MRDQAGDMVAGLVSEPLSSEDVFSELTVQRVSYFSLHLSESVKDPNSITVE